MAASFKTKARKSPPVGITGPTGPIGVTGPTGDVGPGGVTVELDSETLDRLWVANGIINAISYLTKRPYYTDRRSYDDCFVYALSAVSYEGLEISDYQVHGDGAAHFMIKIDDKLNNIQCSTLTGIEFNTELNDPVAIEKIVEFINVAMSYDEGTGGTGMGGLNGPS